jgi:ferredoxin-NADP reductase
MSIPSVTPSSSRSAVGRPVDATRAARRRTGGLAQRLLGTQLADALAGPHNVDHYLEILRPDWAVKRIRGKVVAVRHQNADSITLTLQPTGTWPGFRAGQHVEIAVEIDGVRHRRCYSPSGSARRSTKTLELTIRTHDEGVVSQHLKRHAQVGMFLGLSLPQGEDFVLPADRPGRIVLISGGSGITPVLSMLRTLTDEGYAGEIAFLHYARSRADVLYADDLDALAAAHPNVTLLRGFTRGAGGELDGRFGPEHLALALPDDRDAAAFACGPGGLVEAVRTLWNEQGLETPLRFEHFAPPELPPTDPDLLGTVTFSRGGTTVDATDRPLLEQAEAAGLSPTHGCRMGICLTCKCRLDQGQVRDVLTGEVYGAPGEEVRICVASPVGDVTLDL